MYKIQAIDLAIAILEIDYTECEKNLWPRVRPLCALFIEDNYK